MTNNTQTVLCLNSGSSSLKYSVHAILANAEQELVKGAIENIGLDSAKIWQRRGNNTPAIREDRAVRNHTDAINVVFERLSGCGLAQPNAVAHRVVHGGNEFSAATLVDDNIVERITQLRSFAPLHMPAALNCIKAAREQYPQIPQVACFDTGFFHDMPPMAQQFALPRSLYEKGIRRYGFHGLSYQYIVEELGATGDKRIVVAHLGNGASMAAIKNGRALDTSMGFTPTGGFMMGTRCGDIDPGVLVHLLRKENYSVDDIEATINKQSGLLGISGISSDVKTLLDSSEAHARQAIDMFCYQVKKMIGAYSAVLGGLDLLVFTAGIGERSATIRRKICDGLQYLGLVIDPPKNEANASIISKENCSCQVRVIPTNEDLVMARQTSRLLKFNVIGAT